VLSTQVKKLVKSERLLQLKNSYKLGEALKKAPKKVVKKKAKVVKKKVVKKKAKVSTLRPKT
jgi:histone H1/5